MKIKKRLDVLLVEQGHAETRTKAQAIIMSGLVYVDGQKADKPGVSYEENVSIEVRTGGCPYVSRGGLKLEKALRDFGVDPTCYVCSVSGASTGGFTDCRLQNGAKQVFETFMEIANANNLKNVKVSRVGCLGNCAEEPVVKVIKGGVEQVYVNVTVEKAKEIISAL